MSECDHESIETLHTNEELSEYKYRCIGCEETWNSTKPLNCDHKNIINQYSDDESSGYKYKCLQCKEAWQSTTPPGSVPYLNNNYTTIAQLPEEIIVKIFTFLTAAELGVAAVVSKLWCRLAHDPYLYTVLQIDKNVPSIEVTKNILESASLLEKLVVKSCKNGSAIVDIASDNCPLLNSVEVSFCENLDSSNFEKLAASCHQITYLNIEGSTPKNINFIYSISKFTNLTELNLSHCTCLIDPEGLIQVAKQCTKLQELNIDGISYITDKVVKGIIQHRQDTLTKLILDGEQLTDAVYKVISQCEKLNIFGVSFAEEMTNAGFMAIGKLQNLLWLKVKRGQQLTESVFTSVFSQGN